MNTPVPDRIPFLLETEKLKGVLRRSLPAHQDRRENSAEHSWSLGIMAMLFADLADGPVRIERVLELVAVHDLVEIHAGDTYCYDPGANADKPERELAAADRLFGMLPPEKGADFRTAWEEFEAAETAESRFANAIDRLLALVQHRWHEGKIWKENGISRDQVLRRMAPIARSSKALHDYAVSLIEEATEAGWLRP